VEYGFDNDGLINGPMLVEWIVLSDFVDDDHDLIVCWFLTTIDDLIEFDVMDVGLTSQINDTPPQLVQIYFDLLCCGHFTPPKRDK